MDLIKINDFFKISDFFFKGLGLFAYKDPKRVVPIKTQVIMNIIFWLGFTNLIITAVAEIDFIVGSMGDLDKFLEATAVLPCTGFVLLSMFKVSYPYSNSNNIILLIDGLNSLMPKDKESQELFKIKYHLRNTLRLGFTYAGVLTIAIWTFNLAPFVWSLLEYIFSSSNQGFDYRLPYIGSYPFPIDSALIYGAMYLSHVWAGSTAAGGFFSCDIFMFNVILLICMNFNYIEENIGKNPKELNKLIQHHQSVLQ